MDITLLDFIRVSVLAISIVGFAYTWKRLFVLIQDITDADLPRLTRAQRIEASRSVRHAIERVTKFVLFFISAVSTTARSYIENETARDVLASTTLLAIFGVCLILIISAFLDGREDTRLERTIRKQLEENRNGKRDAQ